MTKRKVDTATQNPSRKSVPEKDESFRVLRVRNRTATVDVNRNYTVISTDRIRLVKIFEEARSARKVEAHDDVSTEADNT